MEMFFVCLFSWLSFYFVFNEEDRKPSYSLPYFPAANQ